MKTIDSLRIAPILTMMIVSMVGAPRLLAYAKPQTQVQDTLLPVNMTKLSSLARENEDLTITAQQIVEIDQSVNVGKITIKGQLLCPGAGDFVIRTTGIAVSGKKAAFTCGSASNRYRGRLRIALKPGRFEKIHSSVPSDRNFQVLGGGRLQLFGEDKNVKWLYLTTNAVPGDTKITVSEPVAWSAGDLIALAPTSYTPFEAEEVVVESVDPSGTVIYLRSPLRHFHWGQFQLFQGRKNWIVEERAEVANLTRNIVIYSEGDPSQMDLRGGHIMVMKGSFAQVDAVELVHMGRLSEMARYPFHWHLMGNVEGQFIRNSSVHHSFQRCITVHGTNKAEVSNNVCYDHLGHGFFLEDGNEVGNRIMGNLGILTRRPPLGRQLLQSDVDLSNIDRFPGPATFWISNPKNVVVNNVAAGSEGSGFWNSFNKELYCGSGPCELPSGQNKANVFPLKENTLQFDDNRAHSAMVGITWDGAADGGLTKNKNNPKDRFLVAVHYAPKTVPVFRNLSVNKASIAALYFRGNTSVYDGLTLADNRVGLFFAFNAIIQNSAIIAKSENHRSSDDDYNTEFTGIRVYDGPFDLRSTDFINFSQTGWAHGRPVVPTVMSLIGGWDRYTNVSQGLAFFPAPPARIANFWIGNSAPWSDGNTSPGVRDLDGSLTGVADSIVVPEHPFNYDPSCATLGEGGAMRCQYQKGVVTLVSKRGGRETFMPFIVRRSDGTQTYSSFDRSTNDDLELMRDRGFSHHFKFGVLVSDSFSYEVFFRNDWKRSGAADGFQIIFRPEQKGAVSPIIGFRGLGKNCSIVSSSGNEWKKANSLEQLRSLRTNSYFFGGGVLYTRFLATEPIPNVTRSSTGFATSAQNKTASVKCGG